MARRYIYKLTSDVEEVKKYVETLGYEIYQMTALNCSLVYLLRKENLNNLIELN